MILQEFDIEISPVTTVKGRRLAEHLAQYPFDAESPTLMDDSFPDEHVLSMDTELEGYANILRYLNDQSFMPETSPREKRKIRIQAAKYVMLGGTLYR